MNGAFTLRKKWQLPHHTQDVGFGLDVAHEHQTVNLCVVSSHTVHVKASFWITAHMLAEPEPGLEMLFTKGRTVLSAT